MRREAIVSRHNKVNKSNYVQRGRLTPDDMARERKQQAVVSTRGKDRVTASAAPRRGGSVPTRRRTASGE
jgi:hypothetical protein